jgi:hypothetical protein
MSEHPVVIELKPGTSVYIKRGGPPLQVGQVVMIKSWEVLLVDDPVETRVPGGYDLTWCLQTAISTWVPVIEPFNQDGSPSKTRYR